MAILTTKINIVGTSSTLVTMKTSSTNYKDCKCQKIQNDKKPQFLEEHQNLIYAVDFQER